MNCLIFLAAAVGVVCSSPVGFLHPPADVHTATQNFIREYNRLAKLAADAPDIDIYHDDSTPTKLAASPNAIQSPRPHVPVVNPLHGSTVYSFAANLGTNQQFQPHQFQSFPLNNNRAILPVQTVRAQPKPVVTHRPRFSQLNHLQPAAPIHRWTGPFAHTIPAGVNGLPQQVGDTPAVIAAKNSHFAVLAAAYQRAAEVAARANKAKAVQQ